MALVVLGVDGRPLDDVGREILGPPLVGRVVREVDGADVVLDRVVWVLYAVSWKCCWRFGSRSGRGNDPLDRVLVFVLVLENPRADEFLLAEEVEEDPRVKNEGTECFL